MTEDLDFSKILGGNKKQPADLDFAKLLGAPPAPPPPAPKNLPSDLLTAVGSGLKGGALGVAQLIADINKYNPKALGGDLANAASTILRQKEANREDKLNREVKAKYGAPGISNPISWAETAGEMAPSLIPVAGDSALESEAVSVGRAILRGMGKGVVSGAEYGAITPLRPDQNRMVSTGLGAVTGGALGAVADPIVNKLIAKPTTKDLAAEMMAKTKETTPFDKEFISKKQAELDTAQHTLGVKLPTGSGPNARETNLVQDRMRANPKVASGIEAQKEAVRDTAKEMVPDANSNVVKMVRATIDRERAKADAAKTSTAEQFGETLPTKGAPDEMTTIGSNVKGRLQQAKKGIKSYFDNQYLRYDKWKTYTNNKDFISAADKLKDLSSVGGSVLGNYVDLSGMLERLKNTVVDSQGNEVKVMPPEFNLSAWRSLKRDLSDAANRADRSGNYTASQQLGSLAQMAKDKEAESSTKLPAELRDQYNKIGAAYNNMMHIPTRKGYSGSILKNNSTVRPTDIAKRLNSIDNANDLMRTIGSHLETQRLGEAAPKDVSAEALMAAGKKTAGELAKPYFMGQIRAVYDNAGGGRDGIKAVNKWLRNTDNKNILEHYGIDVDFNLFRENSANAIKQIESVSSDQVPKNGVANNIVQGILGVKSPFKLFDYVVNSANPKAEIEQLFAVSKNPSWRNAVRDVLRTSLKNKPDAFKNPKYAEVLPYMFDKSDLNTLKAYHTTMEALGAKAPKTDMSLPDTQGGVLHGAVQFSHRLPVWSVWKRALKWYAGANLEDLLKASQAEVAEYIDDAILDPNKAKLLDESLKGSRYYQQKLGKDLERWLPAKKAINTFKNLSIASGLGYYGPSAREEQPTRIPAGLRDRLRGQ